MTLHTMLDIFRTGAYIYLAIESFFLSYLYFYAYKNVKKSDIIRNIQMLFFTVGCFFLYTTFMAFTNTFNEEAHDGLTMGAFFVILPVIYYLIEFRRSSQKEKDL